jgi:hypothetical protein
MARTAAERVWAALPDGARSVLAAGLSPTDLQTLLLDLVRTRAEGVDPARLLRRWTEDRFVRPSPVDPRQLAGLVARAWELLPEEFLGVELSPVTPLATCAGVGPVDQNRIVSTVRSSEVVSDPTNVLALEAARRRRAEAGDVHLAAHHRVLRAQRFAPGLSAHFALLALVSSGRDRGAARTETDFLRRHLQAWRLVLEATLGPGQFLVDCSTYGDQDRAMQIRERLEPEFPMLRVGVADLGGGAYYAGLRFTIMVRTPAGPSEIGDGGLTDWTARLRADAKERCLISCVATERWLSLLVPDPERPAESDR